MADQASPPAAVPLKIILLEIGTRNRIANAEVFWDNGQSSALSDSQGEVDLDVHAEAGQVHLIVIANGFQKFDQIATIQQQGESRPLEIRLRPDRFSGYQTVVVKKKKTEEVAQHYIDKKELEYLPGTLDDVASQSAALPGVQETSGIIFSPDKMFNSGIAMRGSRPEDSAFFIDGIELPFLYHAFGFPSLGPSRLIEGLATYNGNFNAEYGRKNGGIVDLSFKRPDAKRVSGEFNANLLITEGMIEAPVSDKTTLSIGGKKSYFELLNAMPGETMKKLPVPTFTDGFFRIHHQFDSARDLSVSYLYSNDGITNRDMKEDFLKQKTHFVFSQFRTPIAPTWELLLKPSAFTYDRDFASMMDVHLQKDQIGTIAELKHTPSSDVWMKFGTDFRYVRDRQILQSCYLVHHELAVYEQCYSRNSDEPLQLHGNFLDLGLYSTAQWTSGAWTLSPSLRLDHFDISNQVTLDPRFSARYAFNSDVTLKAASGIYHQPPALRDVHPIRGNPDLKAQTAFHHSVGAEWRPSTLFSLDSGLFAKHIGNLIVEDTGSVLSNDGKALMWGFESFARFNFWQGHSGFVSVTLSRSRRQSELRGWEASAYEIPVSVTAGNTFHLGELWTLGFKYGYQNKSADFLSLSRSYPGGDYSGSPDSLSLQESLDQISVRRFPMPQIHNFSFRFTRDARYQSWRLQWYLETMVYYFPNVDGFNVIPIPFLGLKTSF